MTITITSAEIINPISVAIAGVGTAGSGGTGGGAVDSVNGKIGIVVLTKTDLSLGNADNTSDLNKPISNATQSALDMKQPSGAYLTSETDPVFLASQAHNITMGHITVLNATSGTNTGDETATTIKTKLGVSTLSGANTGDQDLSGYAHLTDIPTTLPASDVYTWAKQATKPTYIWSEIGSKPTFASVATSGSYTDLSNKPTIITDHTALSNIGTMTHAQLETAIGLNTAKVSFDSISSTRLANTSGTNTGDETSSTIKTKLGITTLSGANTGDQDLSGKQNVLVSGTNIKTVNSQSLLGSGDIAISGSSGSYFNQNVISGRWYAGHAGAVSAGQAVNAGLLWLTPFSMKSDITITDVGVRISSTTALNVKFGIYVSDITSPLTLTLISESGIMAVTTTSGDYSITLPTPVVLDKSRIYWKALEVDNGAYRGYVVSSTSCIPMSSFVGHSSINNSQYIMGSYTSHTFGTSFPTSITSLIDGVSTSPTFFVKAQ